MKAKPWILVAGVISLGILAYWRSEDRVDMTQPEMASKPVVAASHTSPIVVESPPPVPTPAPVTQSTHAIPVTDVDHRLEDHFDWQKELVEALIVMDDADSLLAAALILHAVYAGDLAQLQRVRGLLEKASSRAPADRMIAATVLRVCRSIQTCDATPYEMIVRNIDSRNALGYLAVALNLIKGEMPEAATEALESLADRRLRLYNAELTTRVARAIASAPTSPRFAPPNSSLLRLQSELALRAVGAVEVPEFLALGAACQVRNIRNRVACKSIAFDLSSAELIELQKVSIGIEESMDVSRSGRSSRAENADAYFSWLQFMVSQTAPPAEQWVALYSHHRTELGVTRAWLEQNGIKQRAVPAGLSVGR